MSRVTCHFFSFLSFLGHRREASRWRVCYQQGIPRLVSFEVITLFWKLYDARSSTFVALKSTPPGHFHICCNYAGIIYGIQK